MTAYGDIVKDVRLPKMARVRQIFERPQIGGISGEIRKELERDCIRSAIQPGMSIALTCGSRGVANLALVLREVAAFCKARGAHPFIVPAMGSHGGAVAEGQRQIVLGHGATEEYCGCPIRATMEVTHIGHTPEGHPVYIDKYAAEADGIIAINRIKAHTEFRGPYESGLMKVMTIGLGKQYGAETCHRAGNHHLHHMIPLFGNAIMEHAPVLFGIGLIENAYEETCIIRALLPDEIRSEEPKLLLRAKELMGRILLDHTDVLVVDWLGKEISGSGADPNVTGAYETNLEGGIHAHSRVALELTDASHGNGLGVGMFDVTTQSFYKKFDMHAVYPNAITGTLIKVAKIPMAMDNHHDAIAAAIMCCTFAGDRENIQLIRIKSTMHLDEIQVSEALLPLVQKHPHMEIISEPEPFLFDEEGNLF